MQSTTDIKEWKRHFMDMLEGTEKRRAWNREEKRKKKWRRRRRRRRRRLKGVMEG